MKHITKIKRIISVIAFLALLLLSYDKVSWVFGKKIMQYDRMHTFYHDIERDSLDVVFVGSSHSYYSIYPPQLWESYGFTSYTAGTPGQTVPLSYYLIKDVIRTQHPQLIVFEVYYTVYDLYIRTEGRLHEMSDAMPLFSYNKVQMLNDILPHIGEPTQGVWSYYVSLSYYHNRWEDLNRNDFVKTELHRKGCELRDDITEVTFYEPLEDTVPIPEIPLDYLDRIIELCREEDTELLLLCVPYTREPESMEEMRRQRSVLDELSVYAEEKGVAYLNLFEYMDEIGIDAATDYCNPGHLNKYGGQKVTSYVGAYISSHYELPDHRGDPAYEDWNRDYELFMNEINGHVERSNDDDG